jgi:hypothetical protein
MKIFCGRQRGQQGSAVRPSPERRHHHGRRGGVWPQGCARGPIRTFRLSSSVDTAEMALSTSSAMANASEFLPRFSASSASGSHAPWRDGRCLPERYRPQRTCVGVLPRARHRRVVRLEAHAGIPRLPRAWESGHRSGTAHNGGKRRARARVCVAHLCPARPCRRRRPPHPRVRAGS